jgi:hypothetical protein
MGSEDHQEEVVTAAEVSAGYPPAGEGSATSSRRRWRGSRALPAAHSAGRCGRRPGPRARRQPEEPPESSSDSGYAIRVEGLLDAHWSQWLEGMEITYEGGGVTRIEGPLVDQAALHGLLNKLRDLRLPIVAVQRLGSLGSDAPIQRPAGKQ